MKKMIWGVCMLALLSTVADAQTKNKKSKTHKQTTAVRTNVSKNYQGGRITTTGRYGAKGPVAYPAPLTIADPTISTLNARANGNNVPVSSSGIVGVPKRAYGFANGHILFRRSDATTFGTSTGSGAVGTGSSVGNIGTGGMLMGVNGKSPYAGAEMYSIPITDGKEGTRPGAVAAPQKKKNK